MSSPSNSPEIPRKRVIAIIIACLLGILVLVLIARHNSQPSPEDDFEIPASPTDRVRARIDDIIIYQSQVDLARQTLERRPGAETVDLSDKIVINYLIQQKLLSKDAAENGISENADIKRQIRLAREQILADAWVETYLNQTVTEELVREYFDAERDHRRPNLQIKARQILLPDQATAVEIVRRLTSGESFSSLALAYSLDRASRETGGDLGYINRDMLDPLLSEKIFAAADGDRLDPFETPQGWHVVEIMSRRMEPLPGFEARRAEITKLLRAKNIDALLEKLEKSAQVEIFPKTETPATDLE